MQRKCCVHGINGENHEQPSQSLSNVYSMHVKRIAVGDDGEMQKTSMGIFLQATNVGSGWEKTTIFPVGSAFA
jgi:hypothetical protein